LKTVEFLEVSPDYVTPNSPNVGEYLRANGFPPDRSDVFGGYPCYRLRGRTLAMVADHVHSLGATLKYVKLTTPWVAAVPNDLKSRREDAIREYVDKLGVTDMKLTRSDDKDDLRFDCEFADPAPAAPAESWPAWTDEAAYEPTELKPGCRTRFCAVPVGHWFSRGLESCKRHFQKTSNRRAVETPVVCGSVVFEPHSRVTYEGDRNPCEPSGS
jgi:hypothetical protein